MKSKSPLLILIVVVLIVAAIFNFYTRKPEPKSAASTSAPTASAATASTESTVTTAKEQPVKLIPLTGVIADPSAELSGMAWYADSLILLPQYPERFGDGDGVLFTIPKQKILDYLDGRSTEPITPTTIKFSALGVKEVIKHFQGYEAIAFSGDTVYLTIEAGKKSQMTGYLVTGKITADQSEIQIDTSRITNIPTPVAYKNRAYEALVVERDRVLAFFEINGKNVNPKPIAHVFALDLSPLGTIPFPNLEYRVTDAAPGLNGQIWVINKFSPKDTDITTKFDPLAEQYGKGATHQEYNQVERLVSFSETSLGIKLTNIAPIQMTLENAPRNWEGLVLLDQRGFLLVTDTSPGTLLGFIPMP